jgi:hypothetical protein
MLAEQTKRYRDTIYTAQSVFRANCQTYLVNLPPICLFRSFGAKILPVKDRRTT